MVFYETYNYKSVYSEKQGPRVLPLKSVSALIPTSERNHAQ